MYADSRDESSAPGLAELWNVSDEAIGSLGKFFAYLETASLIVDRTIASSLIKCGLFPVFSSCSMTPITISSLIPSVSILLRVEGPGEGGGVCSYAALPLLFGRSAKETFLVMDAVRGRGGEVGEGVCDVWCDRLTLFAGGESCGGDVFEMEGR